VVELRSILTFQSHPISDSCPDIEECGLPEYVLTILLHRENTIFAPFLPPLCHFFYFLIFLQFSLFKISDKQEFYSQIWSAEKQWTFHICISLDNVKVIGHKINFRISTTSIIRGNVWWSVGANKKNRGCNDYKV